MGNAFWICMAIVGWGSWALFEKLAVRNMSPMTIQLASAYIYSAFAPIMFLGMKAQGAPMDWNKWGILWTVCAACMATLANYAFLFAVEHKPVNEVMSWTQCYPILSFFLCWYVLNESFTLAKVIGIAAIVGGTVLMNW